MAQKNYILTKKAANDLRKAKNWSLARWNKALTQDYFHDLHKGAQYIAENYRSLKSREELTEDTGLFIYPVREHSIVYVPVGEKQIVIVSIVRQCRDIPSLLKKWKDRIREEIEEARERIKRGEIKL